MLEDERCCGTGTCIINADGYCWCGQKWDGEKMCFPDRQDSSDPEPQLKDQDHAQANTPGD